MQRENRLMISMDVEEFDIPEEFGQSVPLEEKLEVSHQGLLQALALFREYNVRATFFVTAFWASHHPALIKEMSEQHEIASHLFFHTGFEKSHLESSRLVLEEITGKPVYGFRMPRLQPVNYTDLLRAGYKYDASLNPTWLPGRYNHFTKPRLPFQQDGLWIMPSSVSPVFRYPVFWLSVKNMPDVVTHYFSRRILEKDGQLSFYFHPWELSELQAYKKLPGYIRNTSGVKMYKKMERFLQFLGKQGRFCTHMDYLQEIGAASV